MAGPNDIRSVVPKLVPTGEQPTKQTQNKSTKISAEDAARLAQHAGFDRSKRKRRGLGIGDSAQAPIPLPDDELDADAWSQSALENVRESLDKAGPQLERAASMAGEGGSVAESLLESIFLPTEDDVAKLQEVSEREPDAAPPNLDAACENLERIFGITIDADQPMAQKLMAMGLVVAGEREQVLAAQESAVSDRALISGVQNVAKKANQAVGEAQKMNRGIDQQLSVHRTFVFKR